MPNYPALLVKKGRFGKSLIAPLNRFYVLCSAARRLEMAFKKQNIYFMA
jgi:hypothetical protein